MKILVVHDGNNTGIMANAIADEVMFLKETQVILKSVDKVKTEELAEADAIILGSPTINSNIGIKMKALIKRLGLQFKGKIGSAFGSYGWSVEVTGS
ncbi:MAG: anaerobic nitric oxide reductase flavorubredoxin [Thermoproteota archaeon]|nr:anaerobic nitric oxide reductase flavorubredoxin [Thermoproteota archaeon]